MTPKEFATLCKTAKACYEASYDGEWKYGKTIRQAAEETCPKPWATVVTCLLTAGYSDIWEWCDEVEAE